MATNPGTPYQLRRSWVHSVLILCRKMIQPITLWTGSWHII